jgi:aspartate aminotransferase
MEAGTFRERPLEFALDRRFEGMSCSATLAINEKSRALSAAGRTVYRFGFGQSPFPVPGRMVAELQRQAWRKEYLDVRGLPSLRQAVADYHARTQGLDIDPDQVIVGPGCKELMFLLQLVLDAEVLIPTPAWVSYAPQARLAGRRWRFLHTRAEEHWRLTPEALDEATRTGDPALLILNYPQNPGGATYGGDDLRALAEVAERNRVIVLSDEIYGELHHTGAHLSIARWYPEGSIVCTGLSKWCGAGGWRLGTLAFPRPLAPIAAGVAAAASETYTTSSAPIQYAAVAAFEPDPEMDAYRATVRRFLGILGGMVCRRLSSAGIAVVEPEGGFYVFPDFSGRAKGCSGSMQMCSRILDEAGVALLPGVDFGRPPEELAARLAYVGFDGRWALADVQNGATLDKAFVERHAATVLEGVEALCRWA